jgi:hypothetical protein
METLGMIYIYSIASGKTFLLKRKESNIMEAPGNLHDDHVLLDAMKLEGQVLIF